MALWHLTNKFWNFSFAFSDFLPLRVLLGQRSRSPLFLRVLEPSKS